MAQATATLCASMGSSYTGSPTHDKLRSPPFSSFLSTLIGPGLRLAVDSRKPNGELITIMNEDGEAVPPSFTLHPIIEVMGRLKKDKLGLSLLDYNGYNHFDPAIRT